MNLHIRILPFYFLLLFSTLESNAQNGIDSVTILKEILKTTGNTEEKVGVLMRISTFLHTSANPEALSYARQSLELARLINYKKGQVQATNTVGKIYFDYGDSKQALTYLLFAMRTSQEIKFWRGQINALNNLGVIQTKLENLDKAYWYFNRALLLNRKLKDSLAIRTNLHNIGKVLLAKHKPGEALSYFKQAYMIDSLTGSKNINNINRKSSNLGEIAKSYMQLQNYDKALFYCNENKRLAEHHNLFFSLANAYTITTSVYIKTKNYVEAKKYCLLGLNLANVHKMREMKLELYKYLYEIYEATENLRLALFYHKTYHSLYDSLYDEENIKQTHQMAALYESNLKDEQIKSLSKDKEIAYAMANSERLFTNFIIVISLLMILMGFIVARNLILKHHKRLSEEKALAEIDKKRFERDNARLMHENVSAQYEVLKSKINPHFLFNSLAALSSIIPEDAHKAEEFIAHFSDFYRKIIETGDVELLSLKDELNIVETYLYLQKIAVGENLITDISIAEACIQLLVPPFAVQMVVENAIKHNEISSSNPLKISIITNGNSVVITNSIRKRTNEPASTGIGEKNIIERYRLFSANIPEFRDSVTEYIVRLPLLGE